MKRNKEIAYQYDKVLTEEGELKLCGREACKELIILLKEEHPHEYFGNETTGQLDIETVRKYQERYRECA